MASYFSIWPIHVALHGPKQTLIARDKRLWLASVLNLIADGTGFRLARALTEAPYDLFTQLERKIPDNVT